jgi:hypothetical protein
VTEPPGTGTGGENEGTQLQGLEPENFPRFALNEIMDLIIDYELYSQKSYYDKSIELLFNKKKPNNNNIKLVVHHTDKEPYIINISNLFNLINNPTYLVFKKNVKAGLNHRDILLKTCIVTVMEDDKYVDAVCLIEEESSEWPAGYEHFPGIMQKLYEDKAWQSRKGELPGPEDAVVTSSIVTPDMSVQRREGTTIYHTAADWYIAKRSDKAKNNDPPPTN